jgi:hypothetical protein
LLNKFSFTGLAVDFAHSDATVPVELFSELKNVGYCMFLIPFDAGDGGIKLFGIA